MSTFQVKLAAIIFMAIDHIGYIFFPHLLLLRIIGRLSFPLLAWLIANGSNHTRNMQKYLILLFLFAVISQIPYILLNKRVDPTFWNLNALFVLFLGLLAINLIQVTKNKMLGLALAGICAILANIFQVDYGAAGVISIIFFYLYFKDFKKMAIAQAIIQLIFFCVNVILPFVRHRAWDISAVDIVEPFSLFSLLLIGMYTGKEGKKKKYLFYWFYPIHLFILYLITFLVW